MAKLYFIEENGLVKLLLDSPSEKVNSVAGEIELTGGTKIEQILEANSLINFWLDKPAAQDNIIKFSGIIPGGYEGTGGQILAFRVQGSALSTTRVTLKEAQVLLHDGLGTPATVETPVFNFVPSEVVDLADSISPEVFQPEISTDPNLFAGQKFLVFQTQDKQTGIDHYEVRENWSDWRVAESPYLLENQKFNLSVSVKAVDLSGNERVETVFSPVWSYLSYAAGAIIILSLILWFFKRKNFSSSV